MSGERYLQTLGLRLGCTQDDVKKAYKSKALLYHPDRNPGSTTAADSFKLVHQAYEFLTKNPSSLTTPSFTSASNSYFGTAGTSSAAAGKGYGGRTSTGGYTFSQKPSTPFMSEAELFGSTDFGDFGSKKPTAGRRAKSWKKEEAKPSSADGSPKAGDDSPPRPPPRSAQSFSGGKPTSPLREDTSEKINADRDRATRTRRDSEYDGTGKGRREGRERVNIPAYTPSSVDDDAHSRFDMFEKLKKSNDYFRTGEVPPKNERQAWESSKQRMRDFDKAREEAQAKLDAAEAMEKMARDERRKRIDEETKKEWDKYMADMENESVKKNINGALRRAERRQQDESKADRLLREVAADRRRMKAEEFSRGMPSTTTIGTMSEGDLTLLVGVLQERLNYAQTILSHKNNGACAVCHHSTRSAKCSFKCTHHAVCELCFESAVDCPICGALKA